jgi:hypothetical protein
VYTIRPRLIMPGGTVQMPDGVARRFWLTVKTPADAAAGRYRGTVSIQPEHGQASQWPVEFRVRAGALDPVDIPAGPWGYRIDLPWRGGEPEAAAFNRDMALKSLRKMREYGFTAFSGVPTIAYRGFADGRPSLDFTAADAQMALAKELGFLAVVTYGGGVSGINAYYQDTAAMTQAGFRDYADFIRAVYSEIQSHADREGWLPVYYNLGDEPIGADLDRSAQNAEAYRKAFPAGPPLFTAASSFTGDNANDPHFRLSKAVHVANWNSHDEASVNLLRRTGGAWAFYNGGNRWTYGTYMVKAVREFDLKFRLSWHWNVVAGDPYYALDCREDDYAWCNSSPAGDLIPSVHFEQLREGLDDYRRLLTLARLANESSGTPAAQAARQLIEDRLSRFRLGQRDHAALFPATDWTDFRTSVDDAIEALRRK